ncbi:MAG: CvpA family protein [Rubritepida sp.]|nr:CvpA family protein [Rubritepida sp.]
MTWVDGALLFVLIVSAILAFLRGFVREFLGVAAWIGAAFAAFWALEPLSAMIADAIEPAWLADAIVIGAVFLAVLVVLKLVIHALAGRVQDSPLGGVDRSLGALFGLARGGAIAVFGYVLAGMFFPAVDRWPEPVREARALPYVVDGARWLAAQLPEEYRPRIAEPPVRRIPTHEELLRPPARPRT